VVWFLDEAVAGCAVLEVTPYGVKMAWQMEVGVSAEKTMSGAVEPTEMELRVAKVLDSDAFADDEPDYGRAHQANMAAKAIERARAAIRAMMEPTEAMVDSAYDRDVTGGKMACERMWMDMVKAATQGDR
jgi:hypothetical protein